MIFAFLQLIINRAGDRRRGGAERGYGRWRRGWWGNSDPFQWTSPMSI